MGDLEARLDELRRKLESLELLRQDLGDALTDRKKAELEAQIRTLVHTGGGAAFAGDVRVEDGDLVGRDQVVHGDRIGQDKVGGDKVGGDKVIGTQTSIGDISGGTGFAIGPGAQATVTQGVDGEALARLFADVYRQIEARPQDPDVDKGEMAETVQKIEQEVVKGAEANPNKVARWLRFLAGMADDILDVTVACLTHPAAGVAEVIRKVAHKAKEEAA